MLRRVREFALGLAMVLACARTSAADRTLVFDVYLEDDPIGRQTFHLSEDAGETRVSIEASLDYKILFFTVYSYRHSNEERWRGGCLTSIVSTTDDNGDEFRLRGKANDNKFLIETGKRREELDGCVRSFAYWDPQYLRADKLLNSQTGDYEPVTLRLVGNETVTVMDVPRQAKRYALESEKFHIDLWYSADDEWLGLESKSKGGRALRYVLTN